MAGILQIVSNAAALGQMAYRLTADVAGEVFREAEVHAPGTGRFVRRSAGLAAAPVRFGSRVVAEAGTRPVVAAFRAVDLVSRRLSRALNPRIPVLIPLIGAALLAGILSEPEEVVS